MSEEALKHEPEGVAVTTEKAKSRLSPETSSAKPAGASAGVIVLQWLTYAFWGWAIIALAFVVGLVLTSFIMHENTAGAVPYAMASMLVLFPIAIACDLFYSRFETAKKTGASMVIMVIHAVIFALCGIGSLVVAIWLIIALSIGQIDVDGDKPTMVGISTALIIAVVYAVTFVRTLNPFNRSVTGRIYTIGMSVLGLLFIVLCFAGPVAESARLRDDRLIERNLSSVSNEVEDYTRTNKELPRDLSQLSLSSDARTLVERNLVTYKAEGKYVPSSPDYSDRTTNRTTYRYQLCVEYKGAKNEDRDYNSSDAYKSYVSTYSHSAGKTCYKLEASTYATYDN